MNKTKQNRLPKIAHYLAYAGALPFLVLSLFSLLGYESQSVLGISVEVWMAIYAALILSFLGAIHWGVAIALNNDLDESASNKLFIYSVVPSLCAWFSFLLSLKLTLLLLALIVLLAYVMDHLLLFKKLERVISQDFARLRLHLSVIVSLALIITALNLS